MITVAIPTLGRQESVLRAIDSVSSQASAHPFENLVLDNGCDDQLERRVRAAAEISPARLEYVPVPAIGLHSGRHEAARRAAGEILAYLDDDVLVQPGWLDAIATAFADPGVQLAGGRCLPSYESEPSTWLDAFWDTGADGTRFCAALSLVDPGDSPRDIDPLFIFGANFAIRKASLESLGGFHPDGLPWDLRRFRGDGESAVALAAKRGGFRSAYSPDATVLHRVPSSRMTDEYFQRRAFLGGISRSFTEARDEQAGMSRGSPRLRDRVFRRIHSLSPRTHTARPQGDAAVRRARWDEAEVAGVAYHQDQMRSNPVVRAWVHRPDFWDAVVPGETGSQLTAFGAPGATPTGAPAPRR